MGTHLAIVVHVVLRPLRRRLLGDLAVLAQLALLDHLFLLDGLGAEAPAAGVRVALHDAALDLGDDAVVARRELDGGHLRDGERDRLALGRHEHDLLVERDVRLVAEQAGDHELRAVADGVDRAVFDDDPLVAREQGLEGADHASEVRLCGWSQAD